ncbi:MAG: 30S ribosomal protein S6 [Kiritimatiellae bacterium]|nr:30S ribosomal protein S6 [Kiritimatiellia bacterium]
MYEGMFILPKALTDDQLDGALDSIRKDIEKFGGEVKNSVRLGKRPFSRPMKKQDAGYYYVIDVEMEGDQITPLKERLKLNEFVFRVQIVRKEENAGVPVAVAAE